MGTIGFLVDEGKRLVRNSYLERFPGGIKAHIEGYSMPKENYVCRSDPDLSVEVFSRDLLGAEGWVEETRNKDRNGTYLGKTGRFGYTSNGHKYLVHNAVADYDDILRIKVSGDANGDHRSFLIGSISDYSEEILADRLILHHCIDNTWIRGHRDMERKISAVLEELGGIYFNGPHS